MEKETKKRENMREKDKEREREKERIKAEEKIWNNFTVIKFYGTPTSHLH